MHDAPRQMLALTSPQRRPPCTVSHHSNFPGAHMRGGLKVGTSYALTQPSKPSCCHVSAARVWAKRLISYFLAAASVCLRSLRKHCTPAHEGRAIQDQCINLSFSPETCSWKTPALFVALGWSFAFPPIQTAHTVTV